ncbi:Secretion activator protein [Caballeronia sordidicola]|uniref:Secretion activator protein n=1 Tax=Caballeronia sordidicola TaxID=196367 RepID=A0A226X4A7_CABSO|nr:Secretion activator protein [Caballeronia sordidicola]
MTDAGAGQTLDLDAGVRCIADGHVIAYRINQTYPVSEVSGAHSEATAPAPYSTGFALVRHAMEFPRGTTLTFYSLYMHLQAYEDYTNDSKRQKPAYWTTQFQVTEFAKDTPAASRTGQPAEAGQEGLRVRQKPPHGSPIGLLPQGASVSIGERQKGWGRISELHGSSLYAPVAGGFVEPSAAVGGWIFLGNENGGPLVQEVMPDTSFDRVIFPLSAVSKAVDSGPGVPIKAGELIGHLGRYDSLNQRTAGTRMVHIEVFCDDSIVSFITQGRAWVEEHGPHPKDWPALGLSAEPAILRIAPKTKLYPVHDKDGEGADAPLTDVIQVYALAELGRDKSKQFTEPQQDASLGRKVNWWHVENADALGNPIDGWVREYNHASGRVTREFGQKWIDFQCLADTHDPAHTIFATSQAWVDYASGADVPGAAGLDKLSPLMGEKVYRALFAKGDGSHAADDLCNAAASDAGHYPWLMQASSRLIVKHESEWANPEKWKQLIAELEKQTGPKPQHAEELKRIDRLTWWDEVKAGVAEFPGPEVFHIHPIGFVGNFASDCDCATKFKKISAIILRHEGGYVNRADDKGGATNHGIAWNTWQAYAQEDLGVEPTLDNLKNLTGEQAETIYLNRYWEPRGFCKFNDQRVALMVYDWTITSGGASKQIQNMLNKKYDANVGADGVVGAETVDALNQVENQESLLQEIADLRRQYYTNLTVRDSTQNVNLKGWLNRVDSCLQVEG